MVDSDCLALCNLGPSCDTRAISQTAANLFQQQFAGCTFPGCLKPCLPASCNQGVCQ
jgi:hypothetical protein